ncbi:MAG: amidohydrolase family protein [Chloroflexota bacterium]|nr:amidohydrolase family protein [Chloroflexota bacterium]
MPVTLLRDADIFTADAEHRVLAGGWLAIADGRIVDLGPAGTAPRGAGSDAVVDLSGHALLPGLVNAHTHSPMILFRGRAEGHSLLTMDGWWRAIREPELHLIAADIQPAAALSYAEMALCGTTLVADQYFFAGEVYAAAHASGMRAVVAYGIVELGDEERGERELAAALAFVGHAGNDGNDRLQGWIGPHAPFVDNSESLLRAEAAAAKTHGVGLHLHMAVGPEDNEHTLASRGVTAAVALDQIGFFEARVLAAHCLDLVAADIAVFANAKHAAVVHCPTAGLRSGRPAITPVVDLLAAGVTVALGTDNAAANTSYDLFTEMKTAGLAASHREGRASALPAGTLLRMATINGAAALGLEAETGSLEIGKAADLIAVACRGPGYSAAPDLATLLVYSGSGHDVRHVLVAGEWIVKDNQLMGIDLQRLNDAYARAYRHFWDRVETAT